MKPLSIYVHIPFCTVKCGYCDFNTYAGMDALKPAYVQAMLAEIEGWSAVLSRREVVSIGFGGGTPGEMPAEYIGDVLDAIAGKALLAPGAEVTLEANPGTATLQYLAGLRRRGVTRVSLGAQSFDPGHLRFLDRIHSVEAIGASFRSVRAAGLESVNLDLMYGLPGQSLDHWKAQLERALALDPDHLSLYALTVEEATPLHHRVERGEVIMPDTDLVADMYELAEDLLASAGFEHYELSNWARLGHQSRHNLAYWTDREYVGIGAGAHGYIDGRRYENLAHPRRYIAAAMDASATVTGETYDLSQATTLGDWLSLRLRLVNGFHPDEFVERFQLPLEDAVGPALREAVDAGLVEWTAGRVCLSRPGRLLHAELAVRLMNYLERMEPVRAPASGT
jgi:oxygen-independent coproporphyrinogen III oxidase